MITNCGQTRRLTGLLRYSYTLRDWVACEAALDREVLRASGPRPLEVSSLLPVEEQLKVITSGTMQIVPLDELKKKLEKGVPLNIKLGVDPT